MSQPHDDAIDSALRAHADLGLNLDGKPAIVDAVSRRIAGTRSPRFTRRWTTVLIAAAATLSAAAAAAAATGVWSPSLGDDHRGHPTAATSDVPASQLQHFGVLRRPADNTDRDALTQRALRDLDARFEGVHTQRIRAVHDTAEARRYLIVPVERSDSGAQDALCLYSVDHEGGGISCWSMQQVLDGQAVLNALPATQDTRPRTATDPESLRPTTLGATAIGLVPDGVDTVVSSDGASTEVHDNVYVLTTQAPGRVSVTWRDSHGREIPQG
jgi:hypothetical protein